MLLFSSSLFAQAPTISSFSPDNGAVGTLVTITGTNLSSPTAFTIGGVAAVTVSNTGTQLVALVMPGAITGTVVVTNGSGTATSVSNFTVTATGYPSEQQGTRLVGTGAFGGGFYYSVAVSKDGNTAIVGNSNDNSGVGAAWVFIRTNGVWSQQSLKLIGTGATGNSNQGNSVAISADGNTALVGGQSDNSSLGAVWVWTRTAGVWTQQGSKLVGQFASFWFGNSVTISADGNTAAIAGQMSTQLSGGGAWIFTRNNLGIWSQQGSILSGTDAAGSFAGSSVALNADGNTLVLGNEYENGGQGGAWIFNRIGVNWSQEGLKIIGSGISANARFGKSVAINADGNTIMVGAPEDASQGAACVFTRTAAIWSQQGAKLVGTGSVGNAKQGFSVALSADGNTGIVGGNEDNSYYGATWVYTRSGTVWSQSGTNLKGRNVSNQTRQGYSLSISGDGKTALIGGPSSTEFSSSGMSFGASWVFVSATSLASACYTSPHTFNTGSSITPLSPINSGGPIPISPAYTTVSTLAGTQAISGTTDGAGVLARFGSYTFLGAVDVSGNIYVADQNNFTIRKITSAGVVSTFAGTVGVSGYTDGTGTSASFMNPSGIVIDAVGNLFVIDGFKIRKITPLGVVTTFAGSIPGNADGTGVSASFTFLRGITIDASGNLFVSDFSGIRKITAAGVVTTLAGDVTTPGYIDATGLAARFNNLTSLTVDASGNIYALSNGIFAPVIRKITSAGVVTTIAGNASSSGSDDGIGIAAKFLFLNGLTIDAFGNLFITDIGRIRKISTLSNEVTTLVGSYFSPGFVNGYLDEAKIQVANSITIDLQGNLYFSDNNTIRKINYTAYGYSISPSLPAGLVLNASTGIISGTPTAVTPPTVYALSVTNIAGTTSCNVTIETVTTGIVSGGGGGGLESKSLGDVIVKRVYNKATNNLNESR